MPLIDQINSVLKEHMRNEYDSGLVKASKVNHTDNVIKLESLSAMCMLDAQICILNLVANIVIHRVGRHKHIYYTYIRLFNLE